MCHSSAPAPASSPANAGAQLPRTIQQGADLSNAAARNWAPAFAGEDVILQGIH
jgi:hypothetical protein